MVREFAKQGYFGQGLGEIILSCGESFKRDDSLLPKKWKRLSGPKKQCFKTAADIALAHPESLTYAEGYAFADIPLEFPLAHAWLVTKEGLVVDPTWSAGRDYFGLTFDAMTLSRYLVLSEEYGLLQSLWHQEEMREQFLKDRGLKEIELRA